MLAVSTMLSHSSHCVKRGDSLMSCSCDWGVSTRFLCKLSGFCLTHINRVSCLKCLSKIGYHSHFHDTPVSSISSSGLILYFTKSFSYQPCHCLLSDLLLFPSPVLLPITTNPGYLIFLPFLFYQFPIQTAVCVKSSLAGPLALFYLSSGYIWEQLLGRPSGFLLWVLTVH